MEGNLYITSAYPRVMEKLLLLDVQYMRGSFACYLVPEQQSRNQKPEYLAQKGKGRQVVYPELS